jgi:hypothetical protein
MAKMNTITTMIETSDSWIIPIVDMEVSRFLIDYILYIQVGSEPRLFTVAMETKGTYVEASGQEHTVLPQKKESIGILLSTLHTHITNAVAYKSGRLILSFSDSSYLLVDADDKFEAWSINGSDGLKLVCLPGGGIAFWLP